MLPTVSNIQVCPQQVDSGEPGFFFFYMLEVTLAASVGFVLTVRLFRPFHTSTIM